MKHGVKNRCFTHVVNSVSERIYASMMQIVLTFACFKAHSIRYKYAWRHRAELHSMHSDFCLIVYALNTLTHTYSPQQDSCLLQQLEYDVIPTKRGSKKEASELPWVPICFHCCAYCESLRSDACDFSLYNSEERWTDSARWHLG